MEYKQGVLFCHGDTKQHLVGAVGEREAVSGMKLEQGLNGNKPWDGARARGDGEHSPSQCNPAEVLAVEEGWRDGEAEFCPSAHNFQ